MTLRMIGAFQGELSGLTAPELAAHSIKANLAECPDISDKIDSNQRLIA